MAIPNESDKWVLTPEGYAVPDGGGWKRHVYVRDVQGNIRAVVGENNAVAEQTDYYPYGMPMADVNSASAQPFKFGGKELEREGGADFYDFEARRLDFAIGRFTSPDPLCEQTPEISPYAYCAADPVNFIDPTGMTIEYGDSVTDEQRKRMDNYNRTLSQSRLFTLIYNFLASDAAGIITINFGHLESSGQFVNGNITYDVVYGTEAAYIEELIHAFQYVFGQMDDPTINKEYEAKIIVETIFSEISPNIGYANTALLRNPLLFDYFYDLNKGKLLLDPINRLNSKAYHEEYRKYGNIFTNYYKHAEPDESNYHVPTTAPSRLFIAIFQYYFKELLNNAKY